MVTEWKLYAVKQTWVISLNTACGSTVSSEEFKTNRLVNISETNDIKKPYGVQSITYSHVSGEHSLVHCQGPDVKVVHSFNTLYSEQVLSHLVIVHTGWRTCGGETLRLRSSN